MNRLAKLALVSASVLVAAPALADPVVLSFEGVGDLAAVNDFYNGGTDSQGNAGPNYGINFSPTSLGLVDADAGGNGNFGNEPSPDTILFFQEGGAATMNVAAGFTTGFSFFYTNGDSSPGNVVVYSGLNGTGDVLATLTLAPNGGNCAGDPNGAPYCQFDPFGVTFDGTAMSVDFAGVAGQIGFDNITLGASTPGGDVPEPASWAMMLSGFGLVGAAARRTHRAVTFAV